MVSIVRNQVRHLALLIGMLRKSRITLVVLSLGLHWGTAIGQPRGGDTEIALTEVLRVGEETQDGHLFGRIVALAVDSRDRIFIADRRPPSISVFSMDGELVGTVGGAGGGPGEYAEVTGVYTGPSDSVYVMGGRQFDLLVYDPADLKFVRQIQYTIDEEWGYPQSVVGISDQGPIIWYTARLFPTSMGMPQNSRAVQTSWVGHRVRELASLPGSDEYVGLDSNGRQYVHSIKHARSPMFALSASQLLYSGWNAEININVTTLDGDTVRTIRWPHEPVPLTVNDIPARISAEARKMYPKFKPAYRSFVVDDQDNIWIKDYVEEPATEARWQVFNSKGVLIGQVLLPSTLWLYVINTANSRAFGVLRGEAGEHVFVVYSVEF